MSIVNASGLRSTFQIESPSTILPNGSVTSSPFHESWASVSGPIVTVTGITNADETALDIVTAVVIPDFPSILTITDLNIPLSILLSDFSTPDFANSFWSLTLEGDSTIYTPLNQTSGIFSFAGDFATAPSTVGYGDNDMFIGGGARFSGFLSGDIVTGDNSQALFGGNDTFSDTVTDYIFGDVGSVQFGSSPLVLSTGGFIEGGADEFVISAPPTSTGTAGITMTGLYGDVGNTISESVLYGGNDIITLTDVISMNILTGEADAIAGNLYAGSDSITVNTSGQDQQIGSISNVLGDADVLSDDSSTYALNGGADSISISNTTVFTIVGDFNSAIGMTSNITAGNDTISAQWDWLDESQLSDTRPIMSDVHGDFGNVVTSNSVTVFAANDEITITDMAVNLITGDVSGFSGTISIPLFIAGNDTILFTSRDTLVGAPSIVAGDAFSTTDSLSVFGDDQITVVTAGVGTPGSIQTSLYGDVAFFNWNTVGNASIDCGNDRLELQTNGGSTTSGQLVGDALSISIAGSSLTTITLGNDTLIGGNGNDSLYGDTTSIGFIPNLTLTDGNDVLDGGLGNDLMYGGFGINTADFSRFSIAVTVMLNGIGATGFNALGQGSDSLFDIQNVRGSQGNDMIVGNTNANQLEGNNGNDLLYAGGGFDVVYGGGGADLLSGASGNDTLFGGAGGDQLIGGNGIDLAAYWDSATGVRADMTSSGTNTGVAAGDTYSGIENLAGTNAADTLIGEGADNTLFGFGGGDSMEGRSGNDTLSGDAGNDTLFGGIGADHLYGGADTDLAAYWDSVTGVRADLTNSATNTGIAAGDIYVSIENLAGTNAADTLVGDGVGNMIIAFVGADQLEGRGGNDTLSGDAGNDTLFGGSGADQLFGGADIDLAAYWDSATGVRADLTNSATNTGIAAGDVYVSIENLGGTNAADTLVGDSGGNTIFAFVGADQIEGRGGNDTLFGDAGNDTLFGGIGADQLFGGADIDIAAYWDSASGVRVDMTNPLTNTGIAAGDTYSSIENLGGTNAADTLIGEGGGNIIYGFIGADSIEGRGGVDTLYGGDNNDTLLGGLGDDNLYGGTGADRFVFESSAGSDVVFDFDPLVDQIALAGTLTIADMSLVFNGADVIISSAIGGGSTIRLVGVTDINSVMLVEI